MPKPEELPDSIVMQAFSGIKNTVAPERLAPADLETAVNIDLDDTGQPRRRRGFNQVGSGDYHSCRTIGGKVYVVKNSVLGIIRPDFSFVGLYPVSSRRVSYTAVADDVYFSCATTCGIIRADESFDQWGTVVDGTWHSPVVDPTDTLGEVSGKLLGPPPHATEIEYYNGRIYLAREKVVWATELFAYGLVDKTRNFMPFEHNVTLIMAMTDGCYVGTEGGLYFLRGVFGKMQLIQINSAAVMPGSGTVVPSEKVHPQAMNGPVPAGEAAVFMTSDGIYAGFDGGTCYNLTQGRVVFPAAESVAGLFRDDSGVSTYVAVADSRGGPSANARIGDWVDAEIRRPIQG